jgi:hypothetical protein
VLVSRWWEGGGRRMVVLRGACPPEARDILREEKRMEQT